MFTLPSIAESRFTMGFYDVDNFYDTTRSNFYNDKAYTPKGRLQWSQERYDRKVQKIAAVLDSLNMPIVAIKGVESIEVLHDIIRASNQEYSSVHRTLNFYNKGLDYALLYYADMFNVKRVTSNAYLLTIEVEHNNENILIHLTDRGYKMLATERVDELYWPIDVTIVWGGFTEDDLRRLELTDLLSLSRASNTNSNTNANSNSNTNKRVIDGDSYSAKYGWYFNSRIGVATTMERNISAEPYVKSWLLSASQLEPEPTYTNGDRYRGGYSRHLPTYIVIE